MGGKVWVWVFDSGVSRRGSVWGWGGLQGRPAHVRVSVWSCRERRLMNHLLHDGLVFDRKSSKNSQVHF